MIEWSRRLCTGCGLGAIGYAWALCVYVQVTVMQVSIVLCSLSNAYGACLVASCLFITSSHAGRNLDPGQGHCRKAVL